MDAFRKSEMPGANGEIALWHHKTSVTQSMLAQWDTQLAVVPAKAKLAESYWKQRGTFLLPQRMRLNTVRTLGVRLETPVLGGAWTPCKLKSSGKSDALAEKSWCAYINSSVGILAMLGNRSNKALSYPQFSLDDLRKLIVPNFAAIGKGAAERLAAAYDALAEQALLPLPQMDACPVRRGLDDAVCAALGVDGERVATIRRNLAAEPSVTGKRYAGLRPL